MSVFHRTAAILLGLAAAMALGVVPVVAQPASFAPLVKQHRSKVVHISTRSKTTQGEGEKLLPFRHPESRQGMGSGFIISADGLVVTNHHVVADSDDIQVLLASGEKFAGKMIGADPHTDLALVKIPAKALPAATFGDSTAMEVGDWVLAIGNPLGLSYSVTAGIISAKGRNIFDSENLAYGEFLQTDAAINPGNSGGPLFNLKGEVIGVNTAISSKGQGIGFAVPSNLVVEVVRQLREHGRVQRGWLGVVIQEVNLEQARALRLPRETLGVMVEDALHEAPAYTGGIRKGDVLTRFDDQQLQKVTQLQKLVAFSKPGTSVRVEAFRRKNERSNWQRHRFTVRIGVPPNQQADARNGVMREIGLSVGAPSPESRRSLGLKPGVGVLVEGVKPHGLAAETGLREGDIILEADRQEVGSRQELGKILRQGRNSKVPLLVRRQQKVLYLVLSWAR
jgi:serine protease Do